MSISIIMPAYNEAERIGDVIRSAISYSDDILVIDDGSIDTTALVAEDAGARVLSNKHSGYIAAIKRGFREARGDIIVTIDGDGEHRAEEIPVLTSMIINENIDLVIGKRKKIPRLSERFINWLTNRRIKMADSGSGFRAIKKELALQLNLNGLCTCGVLVLEALYLGASIAEVPVTINTIEKPRGIAWYHLKQIYYVLKWVWKVKDRKGI
jgi:glycosyltransferase involved in cell wall biosynthesis